MIRFISKVISVSHSADVFQMKNFLMSETIKTMNPGTTQRPNDNAVSASVIVRYIARKVRPNTKRRRPNMNVSIILKHLPRLLMHDHDFDIILFTLMFILHPSMNMNATNKPLINKQTRRNSSG